MDIYDGDWRLFEHDPVTGVTKWLMELPNGDVVMRTDTPVEGVLDANQAALNASLGKRWGDGQRVASIPLAVWRKELMEAEQQQDDKYISKWLNDIDHQKLRTFGGKV